MKLGFPQKETKISVNELLHGCNDAVAKMSPGNPHRLLIAKCAFAIKELTTRLTKLEEQKVTSE